MARNPSLASARTSPWQRLRAAVLAVAEFWPARFALMVFTLLVLALAGVLMLPISAASGQSTSLPDAIFTAASTICVTGLTVVDMSDHWSPFGNLMIVLGLQVGGIGVLTIASTLGLIVSRRIGLRQRLLVASDTNPLRSHHGPVSESQAVRLGDIGGLLASVVIGTLVVEGGLFLLIVPRLLLYGESLPAALWHGVYLAISAFTHTGYTPYADGIMQFADDPYMLSILAAGVFIGGLGFPVLFVLWRSWRTPRRWTLHTKLTLATTAILLLGGTMAIGLVEWGNPATIGGDPAGQRIGYAAFLSVMTRSGGFSPVDIGQMNGSTLLIMDMLMFVGGGSASTAGGIKVTTLAVLFLAALAEARGHQDMQAFGKRIPTDVLRVAVSVVLWAASIVAVSTIVTLQLTGQRLDHVLFDVISAFGTTGLSTGVAAELPDAGKLVFAATMWAGRIGTVTLAAAVAASSRPQLFRRAEERPIVG